MGFFWWGKPRPTEIPRKSTPGDVEMTKGNLPFPGKGRTIIITDDQLAVNGALEANLQPQFQGSALTLFLFRCYHFISRLSLPEAASPQGVRCQGSVPTTTAQEVLQGSAQKT